MKIPENEKAGFIQNLILEHKSNEKVKKAIKAEAYYKGDTDINRYVKTVNNALGEKVPDIWSANSKIPSNWYFYFTTQAVQILLANGVQFEKEDTKEKLGENFDHQVQKGAVYAKNGSVTFGFWDADHLEVFRYDEFAPLYDERTGALMAGARFWQLDAEHPMNVTLYEIDGFTEYVESKDRQLEILQPKKKYKTKVAEYESGYMEYLEGENYKDFPVVPLYNINKQSDLENTKAVIDAYDLCLSTMVNNATTMELVYWVIKNCGGFDSDAELQETVDRIIKSHVIGLDDQSDAQPHQINPPFEANSESLDRLKDALFSSFMGLRVEEIAAGNVTATQIKAAYEPITEKTDLFEYQVTEWIKGILKVAGIDDTPSYSRSMIANKNEEIEILLQSREFLTREFIVKRICALEDDPDAAEDILKQLDEEEAARTEYEQREPEQGGGEE